jgi:hypothetical protein
MEGGSVSSVSKHQPRCTHSTLSYSSRSRHSSSNRRRSSKLPHSGESDHSGDLSSDPSSSDCSGPRSNKCSETSSYVFTSRSNAKSPTAQVSNKDTGEEKETGIPAHASVNRRRDSTAGWRLLSGQPDLTGHSEPPPRHNLCAGSQAYLETRTASICTLTAYTSTACASAACVPACSTTGAAYGSTRGVRLTRRLQL